MIYDGPIKDPRHRYYNSPTNIASFQNSLSPRNKQRYSRFRANPVNINPNININLNTLNNNSNSKNLSNSNIYTKQGLLKRNQVGWDAVKLTQYVTQQISQDYIKNKNMLQKFRLQAQQNRRIKKFGHAFQSRIQIPYQQKQKYKNYYLPPITPIVHQKQRISNQSQLVFDPQKQQQEYNDYYQQQPHHYRNVGVNTPKVYERNQLQKYVKLMNKYQVIKQKYQRQKSLRKIQKRKYKQKQQQRKRQMASNQKIKQIQSALVNISVKLQTSNQILNQQLKSRQTTKNIYQLNQTKYIKRNNNSRNTTGRRIKTQPQLEQGEQQYRDKLNMEYQQNIQSESMDNLTIPINPLDQLKKSQNINTKIKSPTVVYSNRNYNIGDTKFLTKYVRH